MSGIILDILDKFEKKNKEKILSLCKMIKFLAKKIKAIINIKKEDNSFNEIIRNSVDEYYKKLDLLYGKLKYRTGFDRKIILNELDKIEKRMTDFPYMKICLYGTRLIITRTIKKVLKEKGHIVYIDCEYFHIYKNVNSFINAKIIDIKLEKKKNKTTPYIDIFLENLVDMNLLLDGLKKNNLYLESLGGGAFLIKDI